MQLKFKLKYGNQQAQKKFRILQDCSIFFQINLKSTSKTNHVHLLYTSYKYPILNIEVKFLQIIYVLPEPVEKVNTLVGSCIAIGNESKSSLAATIRQGTSKPLSSPWLATSTSNSVALFHDEASELQKQKAHDLR